MNIVYLSSEAVPFAKTGGLADVCGTLPREVAALGHRCTVIIPAFRSVRRSGCKIETTDQSFAIPMTPTKLIGGRLLRSHLPDSNVEVLMIDQPQYFDRPSLYGDASGDYPDNAERFTFFCRAALVALQRVGKRVDVLHCNDWQTGLIPGLVRTHRKKLPVLKDTATIMTIHNMAYQGQFPSDAFPLTGLDWPEFNHETYEYYGYMNYLKAGIAMSDLVTTVSPRYAMEIQTPYHGCGLDGVIASRGGRVVGITNGIDTSIWNPETDDALAARFTVGNWQEGKVANKRSLQAEFGLELNDDVPMIGLVGRLADQKGWDLILPVIEQHVAEKRPTQWMVLGSGDPRIEAELTRLAELAPKQVAAHVGFNDSLAHRIEAGADLFVMPSHYEPCGLNQLYSLRYGTVPVVTPTGGLADTVVDTSAETLAKETATGFHLRENSPRGLDEAIGRALYLRYHEKKNWADLVRRGMTCDWSWRKSASQYVELYENAVSLIASPDE
ncbi:glycogen synthase GlgA [Rhodopirellula sp. MGV]|uniref:glycogen synthase GlgA n=1 Tax=Rhodopirellula sp. MGV TaxID=2023130 RepID=UPI000B962A2E|nr:glycogen synthase GlgA [Rhodopirellula sp. MGV]OYP36504.1 starch synthase [Rhodopirellula sp. MGV]PNY37855.1 glycogen synthase GlgA [Rhodopirellula baltica]